MNEAKRIVVEETWEASDHIVIAGPREVASFEEVCAPETYAAGSDEARARIAACAPEALRILNRWEAYSCDGVCPECCEVTHDEDCALMAVLLKAGLREPG